MRGLTRATVAGLLSAAALAERDSLPDGDAADLNGSAALIPLNLHVPFQADRTLTLQLDVGESDSACDPEKVAVFGHPLPTQSHGRGQGTVSLQPGTYASARWAFTCFGFEPDESGIPGLALRLTLSGLDGHDIQETSVFILARQTSPVEIFSVTGPNVAGPVGLILKTDSGLDYTVLPDADGTTGVGDGRAEDEGTYVRVQGPPRGKHGPRPGHPKKKCHSWRCYVYSAAKEVKHTAGRLYGGMLPKFNLPGVFGGPPPEGPPPKGHPFEGHPPEGHPPMGPSKNHPPKVPPPGGDHPGGPDDGTYGPGPGDGVHDEWADHPHRPHPHHRPPPPDEHGPFEIVDDSPKSQGMKPITHPFGGPDHTRPGAPGSTPTGHLMPPLPPPQNDLFVTLTIAAVAFILFSLLGFTVLGSRRLAPHIQRRPRQGETREERLARVAERRNAFFSFLNGMFCGLFGLDEKIEEDWSSSQPQGRDLRSSARTDSDDEADTTMEQELARFREAASMVSSMIAAEEGRTNQFIQQQRGRESAQPLPDADPAQALYPGYHAGEAPPPSYESDSADASVVADGFRHSTGEGRYYPGSRDGNASMDSNQTGSDRLGYGSKL